MERQPGNYWIRFNEDDDWIVGYYSGQSGFPWTVMGWEGTWADNQIHEVGDLIGSEPDPKPEDSDFEQAEEAGKQYVAMCHSMFGMKGEEWAFAIDSLSELDIDPVDLIGVWLVENRNRLV